MRSSEPHHYPNPKRAAHRIAALSHGYVPLSDVSHIPRDMRHLTRRLSRSAPIAMSRIPWVSRQLGYETPLGETGSLVHELGMHLMESRSRNSYWAPFLPVHARCPQDRVDLRIVFGLPFVKRLGFLQSGLLCDSC